MIINFDRLVLIFQTSSNLWQEQMDRLHIVSSKRKLKIRNFSIQPPILTQLITIQIVSLNHTDELRLRKQKYLIIFLRNPLAPDYLILQHIPLDEAEVARLLVECLNDGVLSSHRI